MSVTAPASPGSSMPVLRYFDVLVIVVAAPIVLLIGVSAPGYLIGGGAWIALRALAIPVERYAAGAEDLNRTIAVRLGYMLGRLFALAIAVILVRKGDGQSAGLACLVVVVFAFTAQLATSALTRPRRAVR